MNKKNLKKLLSFILVFILSVDSYAAVGANDGSAFVTKSEFDALVNTFNDQMDNYKNGLVSKIDGAIANYLAGLSDVSVYEQENILEKANSYADDSVVMWYGELEGKDTNESDIMVQQGETMIANTADGNIWRLRVYGQEAGGYWGSGNTRGKYYLMTQDRVLKNYYTQTYIKHYFSGSASMSYAYSSTQVNVPQIQYLQNRTDISSNQFTVTVTNGSNSYPCIIIQYMSLEKNVEDEYKNNCVWLTLPDKNSWTIYDDEVDKVTAQATVTGMTYKSTVAGVNKIICPDPTATKYKPKAQEINLNTLISKPISDAYGQTVLAYEGCPIVKCSEDGDLKFTMKWTTYGGSSSSTQYVQFGLNKTDPFPNNNVLAIDPNLSTNITQNMAQNGKEIDVVVRGCKKNDVIWLKGTPVSADSASVEITGLVIELQE